MTCNNILNTNGLISSNITSTTINTTNIESQNVSVTSLLNANNFSATNAFIENLTVLNNLVLNDVTFNNSNVVFNTTFNVMGELVVDNVTIENTLVTDVISVNNILHSDVIVSNNISSVNIYSNMFNATTLSVHDINCTTVNTNKINCDVITVISNLNISGNATIQGTISSTPVLFYGTVTPQVSTYNTNDSIKFTKVIDTFTSWDNTLSLYTIPIEGYYNINCSIGIEDTSSSDMQLNIISDDSGSVTDDLLLKLSNGYGTYFGAGIYNKYYNVGETIRIANINNNTLIYQGVENYGGLKISKI